MNLPAESGDYEYIRIKYPSNLDKKCILCQTSVKHAYSNAGKLVHCLEKDIFQVVEFYSCENKDCPYSKQLFNPSPRYHYGSRYYGVDVVKFVAD